MYYRRWTRMHYTPALKYFTRFGVLAPEYKKYDHLLYMENPPPDNEYRNKRIVKKMNKKGEDLDTKLI